MKLGARTLDLSDELINVIEIFCLSAVSDAELSIRGQRSTIPVRQIVHDDLNEVLLPIGLSLCTGIGKVRAESGHLSHGVEPCEGGDVGHAQGLGLLSRV